MERGTKDGRCRVKQDIKKGTKILVTEGPDAGSEGIVSMVKRVYDEGTRTLRWTVWAESLNGGERIKTRLSWVREI